MPQLIFVTADGQRSVINAQAGDSVMRAARLGNVAGIAGECGGAMTCLTCHCYIDSPRAANVPSPSADERAMLDCLLEGRESSRLSCQILVTPQLEGMTFTLPEWQG